MKFLRKSEIFVPVTKIEVKNKTDMTFSCYTNVKGNIDHAQDMTMDGAYQDSIDHHKANNTMPKMFWNHQSWLPPVGGWDKMEEDEHGLYKEGRMLETDRGVEIFKAMQIKGGVDQFSIGYGVLDEHWNGKFNELRKLHILESSPVNFACNEQARLLDIQKSLNEGNLLGKADLRHLLQSTNMGLSKRQIENITSYYKPDESNDVVFTEELKSLLESSPLFK